MYYSPGRKINNVNSRRMTVYGNSKLTVKPNVAELQLGVEVRNQELNTAQQENTQRIQQVIQSLVNLGISQENIQTIDYQIYPQYDYVDGQQQFRGYQVTHMLSVKIKNLSETGIIIDTAVENGANRISNITFTVENIDTYYQQALKLALNDSLTKAQTIANAMSLPLGPIPVDIVELTTMPPPIPFQKIAESGVAALSTPIEPGRLEIEAKLEVKFQY